MASNKKIVPVRGRGGQCIYQTFPLFLYLSMKKKEERIQTILARGRQVAEGRGWGCRAIGWQLWQTPTSSSNARSTSLHPQTLNSTSWWHQIHRWSEFFLVWSMIRGRGWCSSDQKKITPLPSLLLLQPWSDACLKLNWPETKRTWVVNIWGKRAPVFDHSYTLKITLHQSHIELIGQSGKWGDQMVCGEASG